MKKTATSFFVLLLVLSLAACRLFGGEKNYLAIQEDGAYFNMSVSQLKRIKGEPVETEKDFGDTPFDHYVFQETIHGYPARSTYVFSDDLLITRLIRGYFSFEITDYAAAKDLAEKMYASFASQYADLQGFYSHGFTEENGSFTGELGVNFGATGIDCSFSYADGNLHVSLHHQV